MFFVDVPPVTPLELVGTEGVDALVTHWVEEDRLIPLRLDLGGRLGSHTARRQAAHTIAAGAGATTIGYAHIN